jgi:hypothetical protein
MSKVARAVITPNSTGICCAEFKMSWQDTWPFHPIVFPDDSQSYNNVFLYHACACHPSLPYFFCISPTNTIYDQPFKWSRCTEYIYIDLRFFFFDQYRPEVCDAVKQLFLNYWRGQS